MNYMTLGELIEELERGEFETVTKQVLRYGVIVEDESWYEQADPRAAHGHHRNLKVHHHDVYWSIKKHNGFVTSIQPMYKYG